MKRVLKILLFAFIIIVAFTQYKNIDYLGAGSSGQEEVSISSDDPNTLLKINKSIVDNYFVSDTIYRWDELELGWVATDETQEVYSRVTLPPLGNKIDAKPKELEWKVLMDIQYKLRYFKELDMEVYAPVFSKEAEELHGKEVSIEGFVIPFDENGEILSLSFNPYASCFFCGKASPASIISLHLKDKGKRYKIDDFKRFSGTLHLNYDDPNEFYYILKEAKED